ncbi:NosR/NirI family protein [Sedimentitalea nanhaiensis]|uniref:NosR/NirI family transcriptional regulator, nitrite reductase regulator n=1 Tax=Sedimentitalea nanhaiensis TaxID=999627 RepID=A0A1I6XM02_9RHOB|nr:NosR/NirI family protein [Sedimentitalea nanhaiensis]SFT38854.1 NosR/NirI family transcriptional regulator, nitrite reductase regulator [Sedimentitalea nanhaiensis]
MTGFKKTRLDLNQGNPAILTRQEAMNWFGAKQLFVAAIALLGVGFVAPAHSQALRPAFEQTIAPVAPTAQLAAQMFALDALPVVLRDDAPVPGWTVTGPDGLVGHIASTWEVAGSVGYSGRPLDVLVAVEPEGRIAAAQLMRHSEPILTLGLSDADIERFVGGFAGIDLMDPDGVKTGPDMPDIISRATVSTGVIRDSILRTARTLAIGRGLLPGGGIDRVGFDPASWAVLQAEQAISHIRVTLSEARDRLAGSTPPVPTGDAPFVELWIALADPPTIGRNILGQQQYSRAVGALGPGEVVLFVASRGLYSHRGTAWRRSGVFDRLTLVQGQLRLPLTDAGYIRIDKLPIADAPDLKERSLFRIGGNGFDPTEPFALELTASRPAAVGGDVSFVVTIPYALPGRYVLAPPPEAAPLWRQTWEDKKVAVVTVAAMQVLLTLILLFQESLVRRPRLWRATRLTFLSVTLVWLGWVLNGQLSVVQVIAFLQSLLTGFHWETFLIEPIIFTLWGGVALGLLFWGRGVFCGWLCPFGALQELTNQLAQKLGVRQIAVPHALHERLWIIKYTLFVAILALSFYSMKDALILAEAEPFKTAISMRMMRGWPFVLFVLVLLGAGLFIERFYCRYLCPLGAALGIPAKLKVFDWLHRRPQCGRECRLCETKCTVGAIDPLGRINPNECVLCLRCQVVMNDDNTCPVLKRRKRQTAPASAST